MKGIKSIIFICIAMTLVGCGDFSQQAYGTVIKSSGTYADYESLQAAINCKSPSAENDFMQSTVLTSENTAGDDGIVYWTDGGSVWHTDKECTSLSHSVDIRSGTVEKAIGCGKSRACKRCG